MSRSHFLSSCLTPVLSLASSLRPEMLGHHCSTIDPHADLESIAAGVANRFVILGVPDDRGVANNHGFVGASGGPEAFRSAFFRLYDTRCVDGSWFGAQWVDFGDIALQDDIAATHLRLADVVEWILSCGARRVYVIGGGHDFSFGSFSGHARTCHGTLPIVNFDAHFDLRPLSGGVVNSGTPFRRIIETHSDRVVKGRALLEIGIQRERNPQSLWDYAQDHGVAIAEYVAGRAPWRYFNFPESNNRSLDGQFVTWLNQWKGNSEGAGDIHLSIDLDVFHVAAAMGTSASTSFGVPVEILWPCMEYALSQRTCRVVDVAELCPARDIQMQTARLAASIVLRGSLSLERIPC